MAVRATGLNVTSPCPPGSSSAGTPGASNGSTQSSSSGGVPAYVWALVGVAAALALAAVAGGLVYSRRRRRRACSGRNAGADPEKANAAPAGPAESPEAKPGGGSSSGSSRAGSECVSPASEGAACDARNGELQDGLWRSRWVTHLLRDGHSVGLLRAWLHAGSWADLGPTPPWLSLSPLQSGVCRRACARRGARWRR